MRPVQIGGLLLVSFETPSNWCSLLAMSNSHEGQRTRLTLSYNTGLSFDLFSHPASTESRSTGAASTRPPLAQTGEAS